MDVGAWIALSSLVLSAAIAFNGFRSTRVNMFQARVVALEREVEALRNEHKDCQDDLRRLQREQRFLLDQLTASDKKWRGGRPLSTET